MKNLMLKLVVLFLICLTAISCNDSNNDEVNGVQVSFTNETGQNIENFVVDDVTIGNLDNGETTKHIIFDEFGFDTGMPDAQCTGVISETKIESFNQFYWCGTEKTKKITGKYELNIKLVEYSEDHKKYFQLTFCE